VRACLCQLVSFDETDSQTFRDVLHNTSSKDLTFVALGRGFLLQPCSVFLSARRARISFKARCNGDSLRAAIAEGKWSCPVATAALSTYSLKARCNGDSLRAAIARGKWSCPVATAALSTYSLKARCNGDSLRSASARDKWSCPVATAALSTYSLTRIARPRVQNRATLVLFQVTYPVIYLPARLTSS
jgi:hypothetical protein